MQKKIAIIVVALLVIGAGVYFMVQQNSSTPLSSSPAAETQAVMATITYTDSGYSPETTTVKTGQTIAIKNDSETQMQFDSDPHPIHTTNQELNVEIVEPGEVKTFTVTKTGTFGYHNHLNPSQTGKIIIE